MLNVRGKMKKVEKIFGRMKNILYLCIVFRITDSLRDDLIWINTDFSKGRQKICENQIDYNL